ncbi:MAG TPA: MFS transporter [bacterium]|jgi:MFS family permease|nr:MFS transporter [bacterium]
MSEAAEPLTPTAPTAARLDLLAPLRVRNFRNLWIGQNVSLAGDQFKFVALSWLVLSLTGRSGALGTVLMLQAIPRAILMLLGGVVTDRLRPRTVMLGSDLLRAGVVGLFAYFTATGRITMPGVYALALLFGIVHAFFFPAASSIMPELVEPGLLRQANALNQVTSQVVLFGAPALAGWLVATVGTAGGFAVDASSFLISAIFLMLIGTAPRPAGTARQSPWRDLAEGFGVLRRDRLLAAVIAMASIFFFGYAGATYVGIPVLAKALDAGPRGLGLLFSAYGLGALAGGLFGGTVHVRRRGPVSTTAIALMGLVFAAIALAQGVWQAAALLVGSGAVFAWLGIIYITLIQQRAPRAFVGRVMGMLMFGIYGLYPVSYGLAGWISEWLGVRALFVAGGAMITLAGIAGWTVPELRRLD